jgi:transposase
MPKLTEEQKKKQRQELYNYRNILYPQLKKRSDRWRTRCKEAERENRELREGYGKAGKEIEKLRLQVEELQEIAYGKKRVSRQKKKITLCTGQQVSEEETVEQAEKNKKKPKRRTPDSYRRPRPSDDEVTDEVAFELPDCPDCGGQLTARREHTHYREDLKELDALLEQSRQVVKRIHESGYCKDCKTRKHALPLDKNQLNQVVGIGHNVRAMVVYLNILLGLSYDEVILHMKQAYGIKISGGEVANILSEQSDLLRPAYQNIYRELLSEPGCHYDESGWDIQKDGEGNYVWVKTGTESNKVIFWFGRSQGKGVAEKLKGEPPGNRDGEGSGGGDNSSSDSGGDGGRGGGDGGGNDGQVGISDDYGSYRNLFEPNKHQLCWAHPQRKLRDLAASDKLTNAKQKHCQSVYRKFSDLYAKVEQAKQGFDEGKKPIDSQIQKFKKTFLSIAKPHPKDPEKLATIKATLTERCDRYFVCLVVPGIPLDNNKAERALRKIVLKRKKSFGSKTQKGADVLSVLYSVVFSIFWNYPKEEFFEKYMEAVGGQ